MNRLMTLLPVAALFPIAFLGQVKHVTSNSQEPVVLASISNTLFRYAYATDVPNPGILGDTFTEDAVLEATVATGVQQIPHMIGRKGIVDTVMKQRAADNDSRRHQIDNIWIESLDGKQAKVHAYYVLTVMKGSTPSLQSTGSYDFDMIQEPDGVWRIQHEVVLLDAPAFK